MRVTAKSTVRQINRMASRAAGRAVNKALQPKAIRPRWKFTDDGCEIQCKGTNGSWVKFAYQTPIELASLQLFSKKLEQARQVYSALTDAFNAFRLGKADYRNDPKAQVNGLMLARQHAAEETFAVALEVDQFFSGPVVKTLFKEPAAETVFFVVDALEQLVKIANEAEEG